mmetsp:Transcript_57561/g.102830  ORF Transcript_57561/g.102830 Transcript_57561/m.102830 type:complete len:85 (-) Transcript_57561:344-598(-)
MGWSPKNRILGWNISAKKTTLWTTSCFRSDLTIQESGLSAKKSVVTRFATLKQRGSHSQLLFLFPVSLFLVCLITSQQGKGHPT